eukprot:354346-Chlamydomonas_euryale.AAC.21
MHGAQTFVLSCKSWIQQRPPLWPLATAKQSNPLSQCAHAHGTLLWQQVHQHWLQRSLGLPSDVSSLSCRGLLTRPVRCGSFSRIADKLDAQSCDSFDARLKVRRTFGGALPPRGTGSAFSCADWATADGRESGPGVNCNLGVEVGKFALRRISVAALLAAARPHAAAARPCTQPSPRAPCRCRWQRWGLHETNEPSRRERTRCAQDDGQL